MSSSLDSISTPRMLRRMAVLTLVVVCALAVSAISSERASAGTFIKGKTCSLYKTNHVTCELIYTNYTQFQCYARFTVTSPQPYPSHVAAHQTAAFGWIYGSWTTAQSAYSPSRPDVPCGGVPNMVIGGRQDTGSSRTFNYTLQLYGGNY